MFFITFMPPKPINQAMKKFLFALVLIATVAGIYSFAAPKPAAEGGIKWLTWAQMQEAQKKEKRKVFIDVYTDWCGWCKRMDANTFSHPEIVSYVNQNFYAVKFDAETKETINFKGVDYKYVASGYRGYNELAAEILSGQLSYPTTVYMDENMDMIFPVPGYQEPKLFEQVINFIGGGNYKTMQFDDFAKKFSGKVKDAPVTTEPAPGH